MFKHLENMYSNTARLLEVKSVELELNRLKKRVKNVLRSLSRNEVNVFLSNAIVKNSSREHFFLNPNLKPQLLLKLKPLENEFGFIPYHVIDMLDNFFSPTILIITEGKK